MTILFVIISIVFVKKIKKKSHRIIVWIVTILVFMLSCIPIETPLLTFSSVESSLRYTDWDKKVYRQIDTDGGAFLICKDANGTTVSSILKKDDGWSAVDRKNGKIGFMSIKDHKNPFVELSPETNVSVNALALYNKVFDKTILYGNFMFKSKKETENSSDIIIKNNQGETFITLSNKVDKKVGVALYEGYIMIDGEIGDSYTITINGKNQELCYRNSLF